jgi:Guanylate-binding protein, N-terminal domain/Guanylate-binding protein, C-terminal domain
VASRSGAALRGAAQVSPREYLESALQQVKGAGRSVEAKNAIRESIKSLFPDRDCFCLVRPINDEKSLQQLESLPAAQLRPEFRQVRQKAAGAEVLSAGSRHTLAGRGEALQCGSTDPMGVMLDRGGARRDMTAAAPAAVQGLAQLTQTIFAKAKPKRLGNQIITGGMLAALAQAYVSAINEGAVPTIATAWQGVAEAECRCSCLHPPAPKTSAPAGKAQFLHWALPVVWERDHRECGCDMVPVRTDVADVAVSSALCRRAADAAEAAYAAAFDESVAPEEGALEAEQSRSVAAASAAFERLAIGEPATKAANDERWRAAVASRFARFKQQRLASAALACEQLINQETVRLTQVSLALRPSSFARPSTLHPCG